MVNHRRNDDHIEVLHLHHKPHPSSSQRSPHPRTFLKDARDKSLRPDHLLSPSLPDGAPHAVPKHKWKEDLLFRIPLATVLAVRARHQHVEGRPVSTGVLSFMLLSLPARSSCISMSFSFHLVSSHTPSELTQVTERLTAICVAMSLANSLRTAFIATKSVSLLASTKIGVNRYTTQSCPRRKRCQHPCQPSAQSRRRPPSHS